MSTIWRAFLPAHCLQQSQITGEVCNTSSNINDTFYSMIHPPRSQIALQVHYIKFAWAITGTATHALEACSAQRECRQVSAVMLLGEELLCPGEELRSPLHRGICFGRGTVTTERLQPRSHITRQLALLLSVTHEKTCSTLDFAMIEGKNPACGLRQAAVYILLLQLLLLTAVENSL